PGEVTGRIVDAGERLAGKVLSVALYSGATRWKANLSGARFTLADAAPAHYFVWVKADDVRVLVGSPFDPQPGQQLDLGDLTTELSARGRIALRGPDGAQLLRPKATLGEGYRRYRMNFDGVHLVADNVTIGKHRVNLQMAKWHAPPLEFELVA